MVGPFSQHYGASIRLVQMKGAVSGNVCLAADSVVFCIVMQVLAGFDRFCVQPSYSTY